VNLAQNKFLDLYPIHLPNAFDLGELAP
jgi:hypothetical protein